jgi:uncharacterized LabA/DUF88 family protein
MTNKTLVFIDAGFLSKLTFHLGNEKYIKYDIKEFSNLIAKNQNLEVEKIFYYTAPPFQDYNPNENQILRKEKYDKFVSKLRKKNIEVKEGRCQYLKKENKYSQKGVDTHITMGLMSVPLDFPNIKKIILISSDSDFVPILNKLNQNNIKTILYTYYENKRRGKFSNCSELLKNVEKHILLTIKDFNKVELK